MDKWLIASGSFILGVAVMGFLNERRIRKLQDDVQAHINAEDRIRRYGA